MKEENITLRLLLVPLQWREEEHRRREESEQMTKDDERSRGEELRKRGVASLPREPGTIGEGQIKEIYGNVEIHIPAGGTTADALVLVPDCGANEVKVFNVMSGALVRTITGNDNGTGKLQCSFGICLASTTSQNESELYIAKILNKLSRHKHTHTY